MVPRHALQPAQLQGGHLVTVQNSTVQYSIAQYSTGHSTWPLELVSTTQMGSDPASISTSSSGQTWQHLVYAHHSSCVHICMGE